MKSGGTTQTTERAIDKPTLIVTGNYMDDCVEPTGPRKASVRTLRATGQSRASGRLISFCAPRGKATSTLADVALRNHCVLSYTNEEAAADDQLQTTCLATHEPATRDNDGMQSWPTYREARGFMSLHLDPASAGTIDALVSVLLNTLTIYIQSSPGGAFNKIMASIPVKHLVVTLCPGQFKLLVLSCLADNGGRIICCCKDQTARNKWVYVFRRVAGVEVRPLPRRALRPLASSCAIPSSISTTAIHSQCPSEPMAGLAHSEHVRVKFLEIQARRVHISAASSAATRHATEVANVHNDPDSQDMLALGAREISSLSRASTRAGSGRATPIAKSQQGCSQSNESFESIPTLKATMQ